MAKQLPTSPPVVLHIGSICHDLQFDVQGNSVAAKLFQQQLAAEQSELQDDLDGFELYPVLALSLGYRF